MSVYQQADPKVVPEFVVVAWQIYEVSVPYDAEMTRHIVAWNETTGDGAVSSNIVKYKDGVCTTKSGRNYALRGAQGFNSDADYVWNIWRSINKVESYTNVSHEYS